MQRDGYRCRCCGLAGRDRQDDGMHLSGLPALDAHHISDRHILPNGGYVPENGITVCDECHLKAEQYWISGVAQEGFDPDSLYEKIGSSFDLAIEASERLGST
jgi:hypothetical protein